MRNLTINLTEEGKIVIFKTIAISEIPIIYRNCPKTYCERTWKKYKRLFLGKSSTPKIKHETLCNAYNAGGLENVDILNKIIALQCF